MSPIGKRRLRRPFAWLLIVQQLLAGSGVALPSPAVAARSAERYPCEHCGCGCQSAEQCWTQCCCYTAQQKVAWARQNNVAVPAFVLAAAERETAAPKEPACSHCHRNAAPKTAEPSHDGCSPNRRNQGCHKDRPSGGVSWLNALRCQGLTQQWQAACASWSGDRHVEFCLMLLPRGRVTSQPPAGYLFLSPAPPTPPPKTA